MYWFRIEVNNWTSERHRTIKRVLKNQGFEVLENILKECFWVSSTSERTELMLPLMLDNCRVLRYDSFIAALNSTHYKDFDQIQS